jgi:branched-chain amino acid transport system permease protein
MEVSGIVMELFKQKWRIILALLIIILLYLVPALASHNITFRLATVLVSALFATSFNLLLGYTGLVSFGQAAYFAIGAYTAALVMESSSSFVLGILSVLIVTALAASILGYISFRATGIYFAILTLALGQMVYEVFYKSSWSGGQNGLAGIKAPKLEAFGWEVKLNGMPNFYFVTLTTVLICMIILWMIVQSRFGKTLISIREDPVRAAFLGINVKRCKLIAFVISSTFTGIAGALYAPLNSIISADVASWMESATPIIICLLGGFTYFLGPAVGALIYEIFRFTTSSFADSSDLLIGIFILFVILILPKGVLGFTDRFRDRALNKQSYNVESEGKKELSA